MKRIRFSLRWAPVRLVPLLGITLLGAVLLLACGGKTTIVQITDKITSLPAGQAYVFTANVEHDQQTGVTLSLTGAGILVLTGDTATYLAPPSIPNPSSVTVKVTAGNGSGVSDSDTFTITAAGGPVVSISPIQSTVSISAGTPVTLDIAVTEDDPSDVLTPSMNSSSTCGGGCGTFGAISGTAGSGAYTVQFYPPSSGGASISLTPVAPPMEIVNITSSLANSTPGTAFVTINP